MPAAAVVSTPHFQPPTHNKTQTQESDRSLQFAAFFADCEHELSPVTRGMRLVLAYNLVWVGQEGAQPQCCTRAQRRCS